MQPVEHLAQLGRQVAAEGVAVFGLIQGHIRDAAAAFEEYGGVICGVVSHEVPSELWLLWRVCSDL